MKAVQTFYVFLVFSLVTGKGDDSTDDCDFCAWETCNPTIKGIDNGQFLAQNDAYSIKDAIGLIHVKKEHIFHILTHRTEKQRQAIISKYSELFRRKKMTEDISDIVFGDMNKLFNIMLEPLSLFYAKELKRAIGSADLVRVVEILTILPPCAIQQVHRQYKNINYRSLNDDIVSLNLKYDEKLVVNVVLFLAEGNRPDKPEVNKEEPKAWKKVFKIAKGEENESNNYSYKKDAEKLRKVLERDKWDEKHKVFKEIFGTRTLPHLRDMITHYDEQSEETTLEKDIIDKARLETAGTIYLTIVKIVKNQPDYFAAKFDELLKPKLMYNVNRHELNYIILGRCSIDLQDIKKAYFKRNNSKLYQVIYKKITRKYNDYYKAILDLIKDD